jgi:hypothetical protein
MALPMDYFDADNPALANINTQYYWGKDLLVAPILSAGATSRSVVLPEGEWIHWYSESSESGPATTTSIAPLGRMPLYVRAGAVLPMAPPMVNSAGKFADDHLELHAFAGDHSTTYDGECYLDNGMQPQAELLGEYELLRFAGAADGAGHRLTLTQQAGMGWPGAATLRRMDLAWHRLGTGPVEVLRDGLPMTAHADSVAWAMAGDGWYYDEDENRVWVRLVWDMNPTTVELRGAAVGLALAESPEMTPALASWPNPFARELTWRAELPAAAHVQVRLLNEQGRVVWDRAYGRFAGGVLQEGLDAQALGLASGLYLLEVRADALQLRQVLVRVN